MARTKEAVRRAQRLGPDQAAAEERCRRRRAAIAKAARVMSVVCGTRDRRCVGSSRIGEA